MTTRSEAEDHLRVIRSLMERSTIYRAISAPTALVGSLLSFAACGILELIAHSNNAYPSSLVFLLTWLGVLILTISANTYFIWRGAHERQEPFLSAGMKLTFVSLLPNMLCAAFFTLLFGLENTIVGLPPAWMLFYGLGLLSTAHFAPRSIMLLGWAFLLGAFPVGYLLVYLNAGWGPPYQESNFMMGATFGLYHLIYAACTWPRKSTSPIESGAEP
jgi:hypothetical protein